jgi:tetratricopeptide (TPR) repeat protein
MERLARLRTVEGKYFEAESLAKRALELSNDVSATSDIGAYFNSLATIQYEHGRFDEAEQLLKRSLGNLGIVTKANMKRYCPKSFRRTTQQGGSM